MVTPSRMPSAAIASISLMLPVSTKSFMNTSPGCRIQTVSCGAVADSHDELRQRAAFRTTASEPEAPTVARTASSIHSTWGRMQRSRFG